jgi:alpha/beta superfamily hydrolase
MKTLSKVDHRESVILENNNQRIFAVLHKPAHIEKFPVVLICHGLGGHKVGRYRVYVDIAHHLAKSGIGTLRFDFRGSGDSEGDFNDITLEDQVSDTLVAMHYLEKHPAVDNSRIGLLGRSFGGAVAVIAASRYQRIKSFCLWSPIYNANQWKDKWHLLQSPGLQPHHLADIMPINGQVPGIQLLKQFVSLRMEDYITTMHSTPLFVIHGAQDKIVNIANAEKYVQDRLHAPAQTKFIQLPLSDHDFTPFQERYKALEETNHWFSQTL